MKPEKAVPSRKAVIRAIINHNSLRGTALAFNWYYEASVRAAQRKLQRSSQESTKSAIETLSRLKHNGGGQGLYQGE